MRFKIRLTLFLFLSTLLLSTYFIDLSKEPGMTGCVSFDMETIIFCNPSDKEVPNPSELETVIDWTMDDKHCATDCSYWRVLKEPQTGIICLQIKYDFESNINL